MFVSVKIIIEIMYNVSYCLHCVIVTPTFLYIHYIYIRQWSNGPILFVHTTSTKYLDNGRSANLAILDLLIASFPKHV